MAIIQQQPQEGMPVGQSIAASLDRPNDLDYPHALPSAGDSAAMPLLLWSFALLLGILMRLGGMPSRAPAFTQLTQYVCDPLPALPNVGNRSQRYPLNLRCRTGDQVIFQHQSLGAMEYPVGFKTCRQQGRLSIWRMPSANPYGGYVFQSSCGDHLIMDYANRAATYEATQRFIMPLAYLLMLVSAAGISLRLTKSRRTYKAPEF